MKEKFNELLYSVPRDGITKLLEWLETGDMYVAPASTKHHGAVEGGLVAHSLEVYESLQKINEAFNLGITEETMIITALCHDLCKVGYYKVSSRNIKNEYGKWIQVPYYDIDDKFPIGHGERSVIQLLQFIKLTEEEMLAIRYHMGGFDDSARGGYSGSQSMSAAMGKYPLVAALHLADMAATNFSSK